MSADLPVRTAKQERKIRWVSRIGYWVLWLIAKTWRSRLVNASAIPPRDSKEKPVVVVAWHGTLLPTVWMLRNRGYVPLASTHGDAEIMVRILDRLGYARAARGSTTRGGLRALLEMVQQLEQGKTVALLPDGPKGPPRVAQVGALVTAFRYGTVIMPVGVYAPSAWRFNSWDRFTLPKPFSRVVVAVGEPFVPRHDGKRLLEGEQERLAEAIGAAEAIAAGEAKPSA